MVERTQALILEDPGQSLRKLASIVGVDGNCCVWKAICFSIERCTGSHEPFDSKLALRQYRYVLIQGILAS